MDLYNRRASERPAERSFAKSLRFLSSSLQEAAECCPDAEFIRFNKKTLSFSVFHRRSEADARRLQAQGLLPGERVLILSEQLDAVLQCAYACVKAGGVFVILDPSTSKANLNHVLRDCSPRWIFCDRDNDTLSESHRLVEATFELPCLEKRESPAAWPTCTLNTICIIYTSGSAGLPKGVAITDANMRAVIPAIQDRLGYEPSDKVAVYLPLSFDYGVYQVFLSCHAKACAVVRRNAPTAALLISTVEQDGITVLPLVPSLCEALLASLQRSGGGRLREVRSITSTGQALQPAVVDRLRTYLPHIAFFPMYGLTECKRVSILLNEEYDLKKGSVGRPLQGTLVRVCDAEGEPLPAGQVGEIVVEGPHLASYWRGDRSEDDGIVFRTETVRRLHTGDYGHLDEDGFIFLQGRRDRLVKRRSHRISLAEVETRLYELPYVHSTAVLFVSPGDRLVAFVVAEAGATLPEPARLLEDLRPTLESYKLPDRFIPLVELPVNRNGKFDQRALVSAMQAHEQLAARKPLSRTMARQHQQEKSERPIFSIVIPTHNRPSLLRRALQSVRRQTFRDFEVIVVDDGSQCPYSAVVAEFGEMHIKLISSDSNRGAASARNAGIHLSKGEYVTFLDDDDEYLPGFLEATHGLMEKTKGGVAFSWCSVEIINDDAESEPGVSVIRTFDAPTTSLARLLEDLFSIGIGFGVTVRGDCFTRIGLFDERLRTVEDTDLFFRLVIAGFRPSVVPGGAHLRLHNHRQSRLTGAANHGVRIQECRWLLTRYADFLVMHPTLRKQLLWQIDRLQQALAMSDV